MATISTIKPDGTGDYTSLALWEDAVDASSDADQHAECYSGGDLGVVALNGWSSTPSLTKYPRIYVAKGHGHKGESSTGAYINATVSPGIDSYLKYTRVEGIRVVCSSPTNPAVKFSNSGTSNGCRAENLYIRGAFNSGIYLGNTTSESSTAYIVNNIIEINKDTSTDPAGIMVGSSSSGTSNFFIYNNTIFCQSSSTLTNSGITFFTTATLNITAENNVAIGGTYFTSFEQLTFAAGTKTFNNNISSDATADDFGGSSHQINKTAESIFVDASSSKFSLYTGSLAVDNGKDIGLFPSDAIGTSRPQGSAYDVGALELVVIVPTKRVVIPDTIFTESHVISDAFLDGPTGHVCELIYPVTKNSLCPNCIYSPRKRQSSNVYKAGGPVPFENHTICPWCGGTGRSSRAVTEDIRLRVYWRQKDWVIDTPVEIPDGSVMVIGYMKDLPKVEKADKIRLGKSSQPYKNWVFERQGEAIPHGFSQDRYFAQMLKRAGGG